MPAHNVTITGYFSKNEPTEKCSEPTIEYRDGKLVINCDTDGAECVTTITSDDIGEHQGYEIEVTATYTISAYAKAEGYANSENVSATLCWVEMENTPTNINDDIKSNAVLIQNYVGTLRVSGNVKDSIIEIYNAAGQLIGSEIAKTGTTIIETNLTSGDIAFVKIKNKTVKVMLK